MNEIVSIAGASMVVDYRANRVPPPLRVGDSVAIRHKSSSYASWKAYSGIIIGFEAVESSIAVVLMYKGNYDEINFERVAQTAEDYPRWEIAAASPWLAQADRIAIRKQLELEAAQALTKQIEAESRLRMFQMLMDELVPQEEGEVIQPLPDPVEQDEIR